jgi:DNA-binding XRE family transcriptional regulator
MQINPAFREARKAIKLGAQDGEMPKPETRALQDLLRETREATVLPGGKKMSRGALAAMASELAPDIDISEKTIYNLEVVYQRMPSRVILRAVAQALGIPWERVLKAMDCSEATATP